MSLAAETAAEARRKAALAPQDYDVWLGPLAWNFASGLDLEANDNISFASSHTEADLALRPRLDSRIAWRISEKRSINLALSAGYSAYALHSGLNRFFIGPGSELSFDIYAGDFWINVHDRVSITENGYQDPTVVGTADYSQLQNSAGLTTTWDFNKLVLRLGYDHATYAVLTGDGGVPDGQSEVSSFSAGYRFGPQIETGVESGGGLIQYSGASLIKEATDWNVGVFTRAQPMEHLNVRASAGYTVYAPQSGGAQAPGGEFRGVYTRLDLTHRINQFVDYTLEGGRNVSFGFFGGTIDLFNALLHTRWHLFRQLALSAWFEFEHGSQVLVGRETFDRYGPGLGLERPITRKISGSLRYQFYQRRSNISGADYGVNVVTMSLVYRL